MNTTIIINEVRMQPWFFSKVQVKSQASLFGICSGQSDSDTRFSSSLLIFPSNVIPPLPYKHISLI